MNSYEPGIVQDLGTVIVRGYTKVVPSCIPEF